MFNTKIALIITYLIFTLPFTTYVLTNFFKSLPADLEHAAMVDGATPFQTFYMVLLPLTMPALATTGMLAFINAWNEFLFAVSFTLNVEGGRTVQPIIAYFGGASSQEIPWGNIMAAAVVVTIPLIVIVLIFQRKIVDGLTAGAIKG
jgi:trehalose/maltose transport system permease protein